MSEVSHLLQRSQQDPTWVAEQLKSYEWNDRMGMWIGPANELMNMAQYEAIEDAVRQARNPDMIPFQSSFARYTKPFIKWTKNLEETPLRNWWKTGEWGDPKYEEVDLDNAIMKHDPIVDSLHQMFFGPPKKRSNWGGSRKSYEPPGISMEPQESRVYQQKGRDDKQGMILRQTHMNSGEPLRRYGRKEVKCKEGWTSLDIWSANGGSGAGVTLNPEGKKWGLSVIAQGTDVDERIGSAINLIALQSHIQVQLCTIDGSSNLCAQQGSGDVRIVAVWDKWPNNTAQTYDMLWNVQHMGTMRTRDNKYQGRFEILHDKIYDITMHTPEVHGMSSDDMDNEGKWTRIALDIDLRGKQSRYDGANLMRGEFFYWVFVQPEMFDYERSFADAVNYSRGGRIYMLNRLTYTG